MSDTSLYVDSVLVSMAAAAGICLFLLLVALVRWIFRIDVIVKHLKDIKMLLSGIDDSLNKKDSK